MVNEKLRRAPAIVTWLVLWCNVVLLFALLWSWFSTRSQVMQRAIEHEKLLEMDVYLAKKPFAIFVDKNFPQKYEFTMEDYSRPLVVNVWEGKSDADGRPTMTVQVVADPDVRVSYYYTLFEVNGALEAKADKLCLDTKAGAFFDVNLDGFPDERVPPFEGEPPDAMQVWYDGGWRGLDPKTRQKGLAAQRLRDGTPIRFDMESGRWLPRTEEADAQKE